jgi:hypothetical protein
MKNFFLDDFDDFVSGSKIQTSNASQDHGVSERTGGRNWELRHVSFENGNESWSYGGHIESKAWRSNARCHSDRLCS